MTASRRLLRGLSIQAIRPHPTTAGATATATGIGAAATGRAIPDRDRRQGLSERVPRATSVMSGVRQNPLQSTASSAAMRLGANTMFVLRQSGR